MEIACFGPLVGESAPNCMEQWFLLFSLLLARVFNHVFHWCINEDITLLHRCNFIASGCDLHCSSRLPAPHGFLVTAYTTQWWLVPVFISCGCRWFSTQMPSFFLFQVAWNVSTTLARICTLQLSFFSSPLVMFQIFCGGGSGVPDSLFVLLFTMVHIHQAIIDHTYRIEDISVLFHYIV